MPNDIGTRLRRTFKLAGPVILAIALLWLAGCSATQPIHGADQQPVGAPGFWLGFWHGLIAPIAFLVSLFSDTVRLYAYPNAGRWYDFGFMLGIGGFSGGIFAGTRGEKGNRKAKRGDGD